MPPVVHAPSAPPTNNAPAVDEHEDLHDDDYEEKAECCICMCVPPDSVFVPCGHSCACLECAKSCKTCPICRKAP